MPRWFQLLVIPGRAAAELPESGPPIARIGLGGCRVQRRIAAGHAHQGRHMPGADAPGHGTPRQDAFALGQVVDTDGGASSSQSSVTAWASSAGRTEAAMPPVAGWRSSAWRDMPWPDGFARANEELAKMAAEARPEGRRQDANGMATTAVAVSVRRDGDGWAGEAAWVGDSTLWHLSAESRWTLLTRSAPGDDDDRLPLHGSPAAARQLTARCTSREFRVGAGALFVMSDGVANPLCWSSDVQETLAGWWTRSPTRSPSRRRSASPASRIWTTGPS